MTRSRLTGSEFAFRTIEANKTGENDCAIIRKVKGREGSREEVLKGVGYGVDVDYGTVISSQKRLMVGKGTRASRVKRRAE